MKTLQRLSLQERQILTSGLRPHMEEMNNNPKIIYVYVQKKNTSPPSFQCEAFRDRLLLERLESLQFFRFQILHR